MRQKFYVYVDTKKPLTTEEKAEILAEFKTTLNTFSADTPKCLWDAHVSVSREITNDELGILLRGNL